MGRITKILRLLKLMRLLRMQKMSSFSVTKWLMEVANVNPDFKWLATFLSYFGMTVHVACCIWIITARMDTNTVDSWIADFEDSKRN